MGAQHEALERFVGMISASVFPASYYISVIWLFSALGAFFIYGWQDKKPWIIAFLYILAAILPVPRSELRLVSCWFFKCMLKYFHFEAIKLMDEKEMEKLVDKKNIIYAIQPHGVMSICGCCWAVDMAPKRISPTAEASILQYAPVIKHVIGLFPMTLASKKNLVKILTSPPGDPASSIVLYIGGIAELFLSDPSKEVLYIKKRKGFIKLALETGAAIVPVYMFGNTSVLRPTSGEILSFLSRKLGISFTLIMGRWGLPIPHPHKLLCVTGHAMDIPKVENPSSELINEWHQKYVAAVSDIYHTHREKLPMYKDKPFVLED